MSLGSQINQRIHASRSKRVFFPEDFADLAKSSTVNTVLHRLDKRGLIKRLAFGVYARPELSDLVGEVLPSLEEVATAIARRDRARILPTGNQALHQLGLSTQVPLNLIYLTDGPARKLKIGKHQITFKKTVPRTFMLKGKISRLVVQALKEIGNGNVTEVQEKRILALLKEEDLKDLKHDLMLAPQWVADIMSKAINR